MAGKELKANAGQSLSGPLVFDSSSSYVGGGVLKLQILGLYRDTDAVVGAYTRSREL